MPRFDLNAPTIPQTQRVWRLFPGRGYQFLESFREQRVGFLDLPGLELPQAPLAQAPDLMQRILASQAMGEALYDAGPAARPLIRIEDFANARHTTKRGQLRQAAINFFEVARAGDLVVTPDELQFGKIWIGRFSDRRQVSGYFTRRYGQHIVPARRIQWFEPIEQNTVSTALSGALRHQHPFSLMEASVFLETFSLVYPSFIFGEQYVSTVFNAEADFLDADSALMGIISRLAAAAVASIDQDAGELDPNQLLQTLIASPPIEYTCSQESDIHSPGFTRYKSARLTAIAIVAVLGAFIWLGANSSEEMLEHDLAAIEFINTAPNADPLCVGPVSEAVQRIARGAGIDKTWILCQALRAAQVRAGLDPSVRPAPAP